MRSDGTPEPFTEFGHKTEIDADRFRVTCTECPWFKWMPGEPREAMQRAGRRHREATTLR